MYKVLNESQIKRKRKIPKVSKLEHKAISGDIKLKIEKLEKENKELSENLSSVMKQRNEEGSKLEYKPESIEYSESKSLKLKLDEIKQRRKEKESEIDRIIKNSERILRRKTLVNL